MRWYDRQMSMAVIRTVKSMFLLIEDKILTRLGLKIHY